MLLKICLKGRLHGSAKTKRSPGRSLVGLLLGLSLLGAIAYKQIRNYIDTPQALLVLGGALEREEFAAEFARKNPHLKIWVSGGSNPEYAEWVFSQAGIDLERVHLDYQAQDTVTNFTTLVDQLKSQGIESVYLITSDDHMRRAQVIGEIVLGSRGISFKPLPVPSGRSPEPIEKAIRDGARAILWLTTGHTGARFAPSHGEED
ncbi:YdcF family protein [Laspinema olomoucense]|uniref:YdcF family protein n=1 Tax=Laspinema olomoucense D3b TaxID=2953688 RepID=A0ABT2NFW6_9CYAN|nr:YdcF family protein [Laspinema sp. D3b]MCT7980151.1 YdcF family protein [Laspinema sp. D3b]